MTDFDDLYRAHSGYLRGLLIRFGVGDDADDLVADTWERFIRRYGDREIGNPRPLLARIAVNLANDRARRWRARPTMPLRDDLDAPGRRATADAGSERHVDLMTAREAVALLDRLRPIHREVLAARHLNGLNYAEISALTGLHPGAAKSRAYRASQELRAELERAS